MLKYVKKRAKVLKKLTFRVSQL